jgi:hypothetical protein
VCDIEFRIGARVIRHDDPAIFHATTVVAKFGSQKSGMHYDEIPMDKTSDPVLNPVALWASTVTRLRSYPGFDPRWPVFVYFNGSRFIPIRSSEIEGDIKSAVSAIGRDTLGFGPDEVGTHSNRSSLAMQLYLQGVPPYTIMLIGRWRSDAFLSYIDEPSHAHPRLILSTATAATTAVAGFEPRVPDSPQPPRRPFRTFWPAKCSSLSLEQVALGQPTPGRSPLLYVYGRLDASGAGRRARFSPSAPA